MTASLTAGALVVLSHEEHGDKASSLQVSHSPPKAHPSPPPPPTHTLTDQKASYMNAGSFQGVKKVTFSQAVANMY